MEYEAALEQRRKEVERERLQREQEQARLLTAIASQQPEASGTSFSMPARHFLSCMQHRDRHILQHVTVHPVIPQCSSRIS